MKKTNKFLFLVLALVFFAFPIFAGCDLSFSSSTQLKSPIISINEDSKCLVWTSINNASGYDIYCNNRIADNYEVTEKDTDIIVYDLTHILDESGEYEFEVVATTDSLYLNNSDMSNAVTYIYEKKEVILPTTPEEEFDDTQKITFTLANDGTLNYLQLQGTGLEYYVYLYSNSSGLNVYPLTAQTVNLINSDLITKNEIYAVRMGYKKDGNSVIASDIQYYNPDQEGVYTSQIYLFDGYIHDFYIENLQELKNIVYYSFVNRMEEYNIKISSEFKSFVSSSYAGAYMLNKMDEAVYGCYTHFYETMSYRANNNNNGFVSQLGTATEYKIKVSYGGVTQCDLTINPTTKQLYSQATSDPYYEVSGYQSLSEKYGEDYNNFVSDKQFLSTVVTTSEQLYWAVENKVTPIFNAHDTTSRAYIIYNKAKDVLRNIISDDMSDYEKALSIFDWIAINTQYDYTQYTVKNGYPQAIAEYPTKLPCFYLEGVFMTGYSVCDGFSKAYSLMCNMIGIDAIRIVGDANTGGSTGGHAWNKVLLDINPEDNNPAEYYLVDITWTEIVDSYGEELSHTYFGLSDDDVKDTHFSYSGRKEKFSRYAAQNNIRYYLNQTFDYKDEEQNLVIDSTDELTKMFDYLFIENRPAIEIIIDYNYMVTEYEKIHGENSYKTSKKIEREYYDKSKQLLKTEYYYETDTLYVYSWNQVDVWGTKFELDQVVEYNNYKLRTEFQQNVMKKVKFQEQYLFLTDNNRLMEYNDNGSLGLLYIMAQNLLIDSDGEIEHLVKALDDNDVVGEFTLYVKDAILAEGSGDDSLAKILDLFGEYLADADVSIEFELMQDNYAIDSEMMASIFNITITQN